MTEMVELVHKTLKYLLEKDSIYLRIFNINRMERCDLPLILVPSVHWAIDGSTKMYQISCFIYTLPSVSTGKERFREKL